MFSTEIQIRWADNDPLGHVSNGVVLSYLDEARDAYLAASLPRFSRTDYVVARVAVDFLQPLKLDHVVVRGEVRADHCGERSIVLDERLFVDGTVEAVRARTTIVLWSQATDEPRALTEAERKGLVVMD